MQLQADIAQVPVQRPSNLETTSLGAAIAAGIGIGFWSTEQAFKDIKHSPVTIFEPTIEKADADKKAEKWKKAIKRSMDLADLNE